MCKLLPEPKWRSIWWVLVNTPLLKTNVHTSVFGQVLVLDWQLLGPKPNFPGQIGTGTFWQWPGQTRRVLVRETQGKVTFPRVGCLFHLDAEPLLHCAGFYGRFQSLFFQFSFLPNWIGTHDSWIMNTGGQGRKCNGLICNKPQGYGKKISPPEARALIIASIT